MTEAELALLREELAAETWLRDAADERPALGEWSAPGASEGPLSPPMPADDERPALAEQAAESLLAEERPGLATSQPPTEERERPTFTGPEADERPGLFPAEVPEHEASLRPPMAPDLPQAELPPEGAGTSLPLPVAEVPERGSHPSHWPEDERPGLSSGPEWPETEERPPMPSAAWWEPEGRGQAEGESPWSIPADERPLSEGGALGEGGDTIQEDILDTLKQILTALGDKGKTGQTGQTKPEAVRGEERERKEAQPPPARMPRSGAAPSLR